MDIQSLYTCIPHADDLKALHFFLSRRSSQFPNTDTLIRLTEFVLILNNLSFNSSHFLQTKRVAMGTCMGPSYACLFIGYELEQFINFANTFHPNLKFTWTIPDTSLPFLDLYVSITGNCLNTDIYFKPTDSYGYLDYTSSCLLYTSR
eukprot:g18053.t1